MTLLAFVKDLLGFHGSGQDNLLTTLISGAIAYLRNAGLEEPEDLEQLALYQMAVATHVKKVHDGDPKGDHDRLLTNLVAQMRGD